MLRARREDGTASGRLYTGITTDLARRLAQHRGARPRGAKALRGYAPTGVAWSEPAADRSSANTQARGRDQEARARRQARADRRRRPWPPRGAGLTMPLEIDARHAIPDDAFELKFIRSGGPGGQNVNKVATAVQLRVVLDRCGLRPEVRARLEGLAGRRLTDAGEVVIAAQQFLTQERNREDAFERFAEMVRQAKLGLGCPKLWAQNQIVCDQLRILVVPNLGFRVAQSQHE